VSPSYEVRDSQNRYWWLYPREYSTNHLTYTITEGIEPGSKWEVKYAARNSIGWSLFSPILIATAAAKPVIPPPLGLSSSSASEIVVEFIEDTRNVQAYQISSYEIWMSDSTTNDVYLLKTITSDLPQDATTADATPSVTLTSGRMYNFWAKAENLIGYSINGEVIGYAAASLPSKPDAPTKVNSESNSTHITIEWTISADTEILTTGYKVYMSIYDGDYSVVYDGSLRPNTLTYTQSDNINIGMMYNFKITAVNANGESILSDKLTVYACSPPAQPDPPSRKSGDSSTITLSWIPPEYQEG
jgi:hypothetical protein